MDRSPPLSPDAAPMELADLDPAFLAAHGIVPVGVREGRLVVRMPDPQDAALIATLAFAARRPVTAQPQEPEAAGVPAGEPAASSGSPTPSLAARIAAAANGGRRADWLAVAMAAELVAEGASPELAIRRIAAAEPSRATLLDRIGRGVLPMGWGDDPGVGGAAVLLPLVAAAMRCELACSAAVRQALAVPVLALILAGVTVGVWGGVLILAAFPVWSAVTAAAAARRACRSLAAGAGKGDVARVVLTPAERDRAGGADHDGTAVAGVIAAIEARTVLAIRDAGGRAAMAVLLTLAILLLVRLG